MQAPGGRADVPGTFLPAGWVPPAHLSAEGWLRTGETLLALERARPWAWGDWWLAGANRHVLPDDWRGPDVRTLDNYASVCRRFATISRRREAVSFKHHAVVVALPEAEQDALLDFCEQNAASVAALREERRRRAAALVPPRKSPPAGKTPPASTGPSRKPPAVVHPPYSTPEETYVPVTLFLTADLHSWAREAATAEGQSLGDWIFGLIVRARATR